MTYMPTIRKVIEVEGFFYVEMDIVLRERGRLYLWAEINQEGEAVMECEHCGKPIILHTLEDVDQYNIFLLCEKCIKKGKVDVIIDQFLVKKACSVGFGAIDPGKYEFVAGRTYIPKKEKVH